MNLTAFCDSDYAGDKETRKSVTAYAIYFENCLIAFKRKSQKTTAEEEVAENKPLLLLLNAHLCGGKSDADEAKRALHMTSIMEKKIPLFKS